MDPAIIFIILMFISAVVVIIVFAVILRNRTKQAQERLLRQQAGLDPDQMDGATPSDTGPSITGWSKAKPAEGIRGLCNLYTYESSNPSQPGILNMNTQFVDGLSPTSIGNVNCVDTDQLALQKVTLTCTDQGVFGDLCYDNTGKVYGVGQNWQYYQQCNKTPCNDTLATVALNFIPNDFTTKTACLKFDSSSASEPITGDHCDLTDSGQILRIERQNPNGEINDSGPFGRLTDRISGLCVVPSSATPTTGTKLQLGPCAPANGYVWWFMPPRKATSIIDIDGIPFPIVTTAPQQLVYFPNQGKQPPLSLETLDRFIKDKKPVSMSVEVNSDGTMLGTFGTTIYGQDITLQPLVTDHRNNPNPDIDQVGNQPNAQAIDYWLYQTISQTPVTCSDCGTNFTF
jgi:hypothetical protein